MMEKIFKNFLKDGIQLKNVFLVKNVFLAGNIMLLMVVFKTQRAFILSLRLILCLTERLSF